MRVLLDTHAFLWAATTPERLGAQQALIADAGTDVLVSAVSSWEIVIKNALGKLALPQPPAEYVPRTLRRMAATAVAIEHAHALAVAELPPLHRDPFDRLLVAQALLLQVPIVTADPSIADYDVPTLAP